MNKCNKLPHDFYTRDVHIVAKELLGKIFVRNINGKLLAGRIVEVEAYDGRIDEASHSYKGKTKRNEMMFNGGGNLYVYFTYGMYFCANIVTGKTNDATAVLIRAIEPLENIEQMAVNRYNKKFISEKEKINLANGPGKTCIAFNISKEHNGINLCGGDIYLCTARSIPDDMIESAFRIGIKKSVHLPWRYYIKNNPYVSKK